MTSLPSGIFVINAKARFDRPVDAGGTAVQCALTAQDADTATTFVDSGGATLNAESTATIPLATVAEFSAGGGLVVLNCVGDGVTASNVTLVAIQVAHLTRF